jgi:methionyl-tRNA formyltransferase
MGTPDFALPALSQLIASRHEVIAVYTKEPKPAGRGYAEVKSKTQVLAEQHGITVYTPKNFKDPKDVEAFVNLKADVAVVAAYGLLLPKSILEGTRLGCINIHPSVLPRWRGAAPLQHTILAGDKSTEVCIMHMDEGLDTGDVYLRAPLQIPENMTIKELHDITARMGGEGVLKVLEQLEKGTAQRTPQSTEGVTYAHKLTREHERIDWQQSAFAIYCQIRAFAPRPGAYFTYNNEVIKILAAEYSEDTTGAQPGTIIDENFSIACAQGIIRPTLLQREGKKAMDAASFLRGFKPYLQIKRL